MEMTEKKMIYTQLLSLPCMMYENGSEQNTCTKLVIMSSTCISWLTQSCFPSAPPCLWIQKWEIFRIQTCLKPLSSIAHQNIMWVCVASDPPRSIQRDELLRGSTNEEHLGSPEFSMELWHLCCEGSLGSYEKSAISNGSSSVHDTCH